MERRDRPERMETRSPERFVGVDVADAGAVGLIEQERLEATLPPPQPPPEVADPEFVAEWLRADRREHGGAADLGDEVAGDRVASVQADLPELADVAKAQFTAVGELQYEPNVRVLGRLGRDDEELTGHLEVDRQRRLSR